MHAHTIHTDKKLPELYDQLFVQKHQYHHCTWQPSVMHSHGLATFVLPKNYNILYPFCNKYIHNMYLIALEHTLRSNHSVCSTWNALN